MPGVTYRPRNLDTIEEYGSEDDAEAEELLEGLEWETGAPTSRYQKMLWSARWNTFYNESIGITFSDEQLDMLEAAFLPGDSIVNARKEIYLRQKHLYFG